MIVKKNILEITPENYRDTQWVEDNAEWLYEAISNSLQRTNFFVYTVTRIDRRLSKTINTLLKCTFTITSYGTKGQLKHKKQYNSLLPLFHFMPIAQYPFRNWVHKSTSNRTHKGAYVLWEKPMKKPPLPLHTNITISFTASQPRKTMLRKKSIYVGNLPRRLSMSRDP